jgi:hypothetical protein
MLFCNEFEDNKEIGNNVDKHIEIIDRFINDIDCDKGNGDKELFIVKCKDNEYSTSRIYLWQRILIDYVIGKNGYNKIKFIIDYVNLEIEVIKEFDCVINYPEYRMLSGEYCKKCIKKDTCKELKDTFMMDLVYPEIANDDQLYSTLGVVQSKKNALDLVEKEIKERLYEKIKLNGGVLPLYILGIKLEKKEIQKDTLTYTEAKRLDIANDETVSVRVTKVKDQLKEKHINISTIPFKKEPFKTEIMVNNLKKEE